MFMAVLVRMAAVAVAAAALAVVLVSVVVIVVMAMAVVMVAAIRMRVAVVELVLPRGADIEHLDVENQEQDRIQVIVRLELDPGVAAGFDAAFIGGVLAHTRLGGLEKPHPEPGDGEHQEGEGQRDAEAAREYVDRLLADRRYARDVY